MDYDILVIGELNVDIILKGEDVVPEFGQVEKLVEDASLSLGSSSAIFACGASRLGLSVGFLGKVGDDEFGHYLIRTLKSRNVDTSPIIIDPAIKTGLTIHLIKDRDRAMLTFLGSISALNGTDLNEQLIHSTSHIHLSSVFIQKGVHAALPAYLEKARQAGVTVSLDPGWDPFEKWRKTLQPILQKVDLFMPNEQEALAVLEVNSIDLALEVCAPRFLITVIKRGQLGSIACWGQEIASQEIYTVSVTDTVGAGDSFDAGFIYAYLNGMDLHSCLKWGNACGALSATGMGGISSQPIVSEVENLLSKYKSKGDIYE
jgi:sugar/nucleoside kinase (ribokinase family)